MDYDRFLLLARGRRSVRRFGRRSVTEEEISKVLEAARWAPSNHNRQGWRFIVLRSSGEIRALADRARLSLEALLRAHPQGQGEAASDLVNHATLFGGAPVVVLVMHKRPTALARGLASRAESSALISGEPLSAAMAVQNLLLAAHALGLGACVLTAPLLVWEDLSGSLDVPPGHEPTCLVALGHPEETPDAPRRKRLDQIVEMRGGEE